MVCLMTGLYELGVFNAEMNTVQWRTYHLPVDNLKVAAYMPLRHKVYGRAVIPSSSRKTASSRQSPVCASYAATVSKAIRKSACFGKA